MNKVSGSINGVHDPGGLGGDTTASNMRLLPNKVMVGKVFLEAASHQGLDRTVRLSDQVLGRTILRFHSLGGCEGGLAHGAGFPSNGLGNRKILYMFDGNAECYYSPCPQVMAVLLRGSSVWPSGIREFADGLI